MDSRLITVPHLLQEDFLEIRTMWFLYINTLTLFTVKRTRFLLEILSG